MVKKILFFVWLSLVFGLCCADPIPQDWLNAINNDNFDAFKVAVTQVFRNKGAIVNLQNYVDDHDADIIMLAARDGLGKFLQSLLEKLFGGGRAQLLQAVLEELSDDNEHHSNFIIDNINRPDMAGNTALHYAVNGYIASIQSRNQSEQTTENYAGIVRLLHKYGADMNKENQFGQSPLRIVFDGYLNISLNHKSKQLSELGKFFNVLYELGARFILQENQYNDYKILLNALLELLPEYPKSNGLWKAIIEANYLVNPQKTVDIPTYTEIDGRNVFTHAAFAGNIELFQWLLEHSQASRQQYVTIPVQGKQGNAAFNIACDGFIDTISKHQMDKYDDILSRYTAILDLLHRYKAPFSIETQQAFNRVRIDLFKYYVGDIKKIPPYVQFLVHMKKLYDFKVDTDGTKNALGNILTDAKYIINNQIQKIVTAEYEIRGVPLVIGNYLDGNRSDLLMLAAYHGNPSLVDFLLNFSRTGSAGESNFINNKQYVQINDINRKNNGGDTALHMAVHGLLQKLSSNHAKDSIAKSYIHIIQQLHRYRSDATIKNNNSKTVFDIVTDALTKATRQQNQQHITVLNQILSALRELYPTVPVEKTVQQQIDDRRDLCQAVQMGHLEAVKRIIIELYNKGGNQPVAIQSYHCATENDIFMEAAASGQAAVVQWFLDMARAGILSALLGFNKPYVTLNVNSQNAAGNTAIHAAVDGYITSILSEFELENMEKIYQLYADTLFALYQGGARIKIQNNRGKTVLDLLGDAIGSIQGSENIHNKGKDFLRAMSNYLNNALLAVTESTKGDTAQLEPKKNVHEGSEGAVSQQQKADLLQAIQNDNVEALQPIIGEIQGKYNGSGVPIQHIVVTGQAGKLDLLQEAIAWGSEKVAAWLLKAVFAPSSKTLVVLGDITQQNGEGNNLVDVAVRSFIDEVSRWGSESDRPFVLKKYQHILRLLCMAGVPLTVRAVKNLLDREKLLPIALDMMNFIDILWGRVAVRTFFSILSDDRSDQLSDPAELFFLTLPENSLEQIKQQVVTLNVQGLKILQEAARLGRDDIVSWLVNESQGIGRHTVWGDTVREAGALNIMVKNINEGDDYYQKVREAMDKPDTHGFTALRYAVDGFIAEVNQQPGKYGEFLRKYQSIISTLLRGGADIHTVDTQNYTPLSSLQRAISLARTDTIRRAYELMQKFLEERRPSIVPSSGAVQSAGANPQGNSPVIAPVSNIKKLFESVQSGDITAIKTYVKQQGNRLNPQDIINEDEDLFMYAAYCGQYNIVRWLLESSGRLKSVQYFVGAASYTPIADIDKKNTLGETALVKAIKGWGESVQKFKATSITTNGAAYDTLIHQYKDVVDLLCAWGADINTLSNSGVTPLMVACQYGDLFLVQHVLDLLKQKHLKDLPIVARGVKKLFGSPSIKSYLNQADQHNDTALKYAIDGGNPSVVSLLLTNGADPNQKLYDDTYPLFIVIEKNDMSIFNLLITASAIDVTLQNKKGNTALHAAVAKGNEDMVKAVLAHMPKTAVNMQNNDGNTSLMIACQKKSKPIQEILMQAGADPYIENQNKQSPKTVCAIESGNQVTNIIKKYISPRWNLLTSWIKWVFGYQ